MAAIEQFLFTSESVNEGHPDKLCDQVSDAVVDACLAADPDSHIACETAAKKNMVMILGEVSVKTQINFEQVVRDAIKKIGYDAVEKGIDYKTCNVIVAIDQQAGEIANAVHVNKKCEDIGAGDQGHMFGYATDETPELMPLTHVLATQLGARLTEVRNKGILKWVRPDGKTQVTVEYRREGGRMVPIRVHTVVISTQHEPNIEHKQIVAELMKEVIQVVVPAKYLDKDTIYHLNPSGSFVEGGPMADAGLTGRKIIVDTYGGWGAHGGGAFSGKDPSKVDRSGAYCMRWVAKSLVAAGLCKRCIAQVSYAIGVAKPLSVFIDSYGTATGGRSDADLLKIVMENFDLRPGCIIRDLQLLRPIYHICACYGHFGRNEPELTWETPKKLKF